ncbi:MAG TPA: PHP-associated domain-containing protein [Candidatus Omnitrophota bacterium]|nr:PHP domain-containing protein [Candidatus Omnitrophota bacterium]HPB68610.1 PHP-associated domain-containing protein [Candidatus Omnitrophota bacterium]HQO58396.1 PHP-associated domain-containing protein [Candidatus Omnitrophota bacterium]
MSFKLDLHTHTQSFGRTFMNEFQLKESLRRRGMDGLAVTNFFNVTHALWLQDKLPEFVILVGQEIWTAAGHVIALGIKRKIQDFLSVEETLAQIHDQGGIAVAVHPYLHLGLGGRIRHLPFDAVEVYNAALGSVGIYNLLARSLARGLPLAHVAGTDTTDASFIGQGCTEVLADRPEEILDAIRKGRTRVSGKPLPVPFKFIMKNFLKYRDLEPCALHATLCLMCGKSMRVRIFRKNFRCSECGKIEVARVACCNGHYLCWDCATRRLHARDDISRYEEENKVLRKIGREHFFVDKNCMQSGIV